MNPQLTKTLLLCCLFFFACTSDQTTKQKTPETPEKTEKQNTSKPPPPTVNTAPAYGIDISMFQGKEIDFLNRKKDSLTFIFCKATEGITYTDPQFSNNWTTIPEKGFIRGAYHFYHSADDPVLQADNFARAIADIKKSDIPPVVDFEGGGIDKAQSVDLIQRDLIIFLKAIETKLNRKPMIYTDMPTGNKYLNDPAFSDYALWIAYYVDVKEPPLPDAWKSKSWNFWQKNSSYKIDDRNNDFDVFNGDEAALKAFIQSY